MELIGRWWWKTAQIMTIIIVNAVCLLPINAIAANENINTHFESISLRDVVRRVQNTNPQLLSQPFAVTGADARLDQAAQRPVFELEAEAENLLGTAGTPSFNALEATLTLSTAIELGGKRAYRMSAADRARGLLLVEQDAERLDIIADAAQKFILVAEAERMLAAAEENRELAQRVAKTIADRVQQGASSQVELSSSQVVLAQTKVDEANRRAELNGALTILAATWGGEPGYTAEVSAALYELPRFKSFQSLIEGLEDNPDILRFASQQRVYESQLRMAEAESVPDLSVGAGIRRDQSSRGQSFLLSLSIPLGTSSRSEPFEREARARLSQLPYEEAAARATLSAALFQLHQRLQTAKDNFSLLRETALPPAEQAVKQIEVGFRSGRFSFLDLTTAQQRLLDVRQQITLNAATYHQLFLEIERLTGQSIGGQP